jgi:hypothetical protein
LSFPVLQIEGPIIAKRQGPDKNSARINPRYGGLETEKSWRRQSDQLDSYHCDDRPRILNSVDCMQQV